VKVALKSNYIGMTEHGINVLLPHDMPLIASVLDLLLIKHLQGILTIIKFSTDQVDFSESSITQQHLVIFKIMV
jgi:hypothetical protein